MNLWRVCREASRDLIPYREIGTLATLVRRQNEIQDSQEESRNWAVIYFSPSATPDSVSDDYLEYQIWDSLQALCRHDQHLPVWIISFFFRIVLRGNIARQYHPGSCWVQFCVVDAGGACHLWRTRCGRRLRNSGRRDVCVDPQTQVSKSASNLSIVPSTFVVFSCGMIGSILFAWLKSSSLDAHCKQWRLFADVMNDLAILLAIVSPHFAKTTFIALSCLSSVVQALVGVAGGTTRAALRWASYTTSAFADRPSVSPSSLPRPRTCTVRYVLRVVDALA